MASPHSAFALIGGLVVDGTGTEPFRADVLLKGGKVEAVVPIAQNLTAVDGTQYGGNRMTIDCSGRLVTPGFVDIHCHSDLSLLVYQDNESRVTQGITTEIVGNCGMSAAPSGSDNVGLASVIGPVNVVPDFPWPWTDLSGWLDVLDSTPTATNVAAQVGHGSARFAAAGADARALTTGELIALDRELSAAIEAGCVGISLGLMYAPGQSADAHELERVGRLAAAHDVLVSVHMRDYRPAALRNSVEEVLEIAERTGARLEISHLRQAGPAVQLEEDGDFDGVLARIDDARTHLDVAADMYPYIAGHTNLIQLLSPKLRGLGAAQLTPMCGEDSSSIARELRDSGYLPTDITIMKAPTTPDAVGQLAEDLGADPWIALTQILAENGCLIDVAVNSGRWSDVDRVMATEWISIGSDGTALSPAHTASAPHPRSWGSFPAAFCRMRELGVPMESIVRRMTDQPASRAGLSALIRPGHRADVIVFDEDRFTAHATYANPAVPSRGLDHVFVNGFPVLSHGSKTGLRPGRLIRGSQNV